MRTTSYFKKHKTALIAQASHKMAVSAYSGSFKAPSVIRFACAIELPNPDNFLLPEDFNKCPDLYLKRWIQASLSNIYTGREKAEIQIVFLSQKDS